MNAVSNPHYINETSINQAQERLENETRIQKQFFNSVGVTDPTLLDFFAWVDFKGSAKNITNLIFDQTKVRLFNGFGMGNGTNIAGIGYKNFNGVDPYNLVQIAMLNNRERNIQSVKNTNKSHLINKPDITSAELEDISLTMDSATACLAVEQCHTYKFNSHFYGNVPFTTPVQKFFRVFFDLVNVNQARVNAITYQIAATHNINPVVVNAIMLLKGIKIA
jgi:hypothetical protein